MEHRILCPLLLQRVDGKSAEQFLASEEIVFECGDDQALAKASGAAEEIYLPLADKVINQCRLVNIDITILTYLLKALYSYWVLHNQVFFIFWGKDTLFISFLQEKHRFSPEIPKYSVSIS